MHSVWVFLILVKRLQPLGERMAHRVNTLDIDLNGTPKIKEAL